MIPQRVLSLKHLSFRVTYTMRILGRGWLTRILLSGRMALERKWQPLPKTLSVQCHRFTFRQQNFALCLDSMAPLMFCMQIDYGMWREPFQPHPLHSGPCYMQMGMSTHGCHCWCRPTSGCALTCPGLFYPSFRMQQNWLLSSPLMKSGKDEFVWLSNHVRGLRQLMPKVSCGHAKFRHRSPNLVPCQICCTRPVGGNGDATCATQGLIPKRPWQFMLGTSTNTAPCLSILSLGMNALHVERSFSTVLERLHMWEHLQLARTLILLVLFQQQRSRLNDLKKMKEIMLGLYEHRVGHLSRPSSQQFAFAVLFCPEVALRM